MFIEYIELGHKMKEEIEATQSEIKENMQETNSERKETGTQINDLEQKEEISIQTEENEETRMQKKKKKEDRLRKLWDNFKHSNIRIMGVPEGEEGEQEIKTYLNK